MNSRRAAHGATLPRMNSDLTTASRRVLSDNALGRLNKLIADVKESLARQRVIVAKMRSLELNTLAATRLLWTMESTLVDLESDRRLTEDEGERRCPLDPWSAGASEET